MGGVCFRHPAAIPQFAVLRVRIPDVQRGHHFGDPLQIQKVKLTCREYAICGFRCTKFVEQTKGVTFRDTLAPAAGKSGDSQP